MPSVSPLSYFKTTQGEGGIRSPFVIKLPNAGNQTKTRYSRCICTRQRYDSHFLEYAGVQPPGSTYNGHPVHAIMGKSMKSLLEGKIQVVHPDDEPIAQEMFNNTAVFMGDWKAVKNSPPTSDGKWHLFNITADIGENNDLASQHPEILAKLMSDYDKVRKRCWSHSTKWSSRSLPEYRRSSRLNILTFSSHLFPHVASAIQLSNTNDNKPRSIIQYVYTDSRHQNPLNRVVLEIWINYY